MLHVNLYTMMKTTGEQNHTERYKSITLYPLVLQISGLDLRVSHFVSYSHIKIIEFVSF